MSPRWWEWLIIVMIIGGLTSVLYPAVMTTRNPKGPPGEMIPRQPPEESNRIRHATGLSIVAPRNWDQMRDYGPEEPILFIAARGMPGRRLTALILVQQCSPPPNIAGFERVEFQGNPAWEQMRIEREDTFDDPARSKYELNIERDGQWWQITFVIARALRELPPEIRPYLATIQFPVAEPSAESERMEQCTSR